MIFVDKSEILEEEFLNLLANIKINVLEELKALGDKANRFNGDDFETIVYNNSLKASQGTEFEGHVVQTGAHAFPDIIAKKYFGIEVKMTTADKWISTGNSILETTRVEDVKNIYMFFGKFGGSIDIKYRSYQECLFDIGVTHSPRYKINMDLAKGNSIFDKMGIDYESLRQEKNPIKIIKDYYRDLLEEGEELWWIDSQAEDKTVNPIIKPFRKLSKSDQDRFIAECFIFFPKIIGSTSNNKYERAAAYLVTQYNAVNASLRDSFSAEENISLNINSVSTGKIPSVYKRLMNYAKLIKEIISETEAEKLAYYWEVSVSDNNKEALWKNLLDQQKSFIHESIKPSDIYEWGLK